MRWLIQSLLELKLGGLCLLPWQLIQLLQHHQIQSKSLTYYYLNQSENSLDQFDHFQIGLSPTVWSPDDHLICC